MTEEATRDRPYVRHIYVNKKDMVKFLDYIDNLPKERLVNKVSYMGDKLHCCVRIKKEELLYLKLAMEIDVKKPRTKKRKIRTLTGVWKTI